MTNIQMIAHNFWAQASKSGIYDDSTGLSELLDLLIQENEDAFIDAIERRGFSVTSD